MAMDGPRGFEVFPLKLLVLLLKALLHPLAPPKRKTTLFWGLKWWDERVALLWVYPCRAWWEVWQDRQE